MKKVLAVVIAVAFISIGAVSSDAQVPNIQVYFDDLLQETQGFCDDHFIGENDELYVVMNNFNMFVSTVEFSIDMSGVAGFLTYLGDVHVGTVAPLVLGNSVLGVPPGVTITWPLPQNGFDPFICMKIGVLWTCDACPTPPAGNFPITVQPHQGTGLIQAIEWQTFNTVQGVGMTSILCPVGVSTEETSWGKIKALYN